MNNVNTSNNKENEDMWYLIKEMKDDIDELRGRELTSETEIDLLKQKIEDLESEISNLNLNTENY